MAQTLRAVFVHGEQLNIDYTPVVDVIAGDVVDLGTFVGIALTPLAANVLGSLAITGVFSFLKGTGAVTIGQTVLWDAANHFAYPSGGGYTDDAMAGVAVSVAASADHTVWVLLNPYAHTAAG
jgi:predicted RecA/RadA family phage recombinase